ncbi:hypothetical protein GFS24_23585 [Chitinophaga sp. SYP-B3965]|uniref:hypothetical protein n=1 Tax=Chitinophaga sp. SYP-B3965 TaxID=2663120 RepID=UPI00129999D9|nr:hypothetical protein [Chitinophaga sp. SYP-B3965]MRG48122.1 hypothetical protein [Chitinophaga sp. SYP-B3965]
MRLALLLALTSLMACSKSDQYEDRWIETSQRQEVIVFKHEEKSTLPGTTATGTEGSFYFQSRKLPDYVSRANESGIYYYTIEGDSLLLKTRQQKFYFKMAVDKKSFTIGRFFVDPGGLPQDLIFEKQ